jgi:hypothetical protein
MNQKQTTSKKRHAVIPRASAAPGTPYPWDDDDIYDDSWPPRLPNSTIRYSGYPSTTVGQPPVIYSRDGSRKYIIRGAPPVTQQRQPHPNVNKATPPDVIYANAARQRDMQAQPPRSKRHAHPMLYLGLGMCGMFALWVLGTMAVSWWQMTQDDIHYGRPRTYQTDMVVGHADSPSHPSHFIAINYHRHIEVIEFPGGDASKAKIYLVATLIGDGQDQDLAMVTLTFKDINGDGKVDMIVNVQVSHYPFLNDQGQFRPAKPGENVSM